MPQTAPLPRRDGAPETSGAAVPWRSDPDKSRHDALVGLPAQSVLTATPDMASEIDRALRATGYLRLRQLSIRVPEGLAILRGQVSTYHLKQVAQTVALNVPGVKEVQNESHRRPTRTQFFEDTRTFTEDIQTLQDRQSFQFGGAGLVST